MKITDFAVAFATIMLPVLFLLQWKEEGFVKANELMHQYDIALTNAVNDAAHHMRLTSEADYERGYGTFNYTHVDKEEALESFFRTLSINFGVEDSISRDVLSRYVPAVGIIDYDGLNLNVYKKFKNSEGNNVWERMWLPEIPFMYNDPDGNIIKFSVDDYVTVFDQTTQQWVEGSRVEVAPRVTIPLLTADNFETIQRQTIVNTLQENLAYYINEHNTYVKGLDINYVFALPTIPQEDWNNSVKDISFFSFVQGVPLERSDATFNNYSFAGSRITNSIEIYGSTVNGKKVYYRETCGFTYPIEEVFTSESQAAKKGYFPQSCGR
jgi:hypothetical protein